MNEIVKDRAMTPLRAVDKLRDPTLFVERAFVGGAWIYADDRGTLAVTDPATMSAIGCVPSLGRQETRRAVQAAADALPSWSALTAAARAGLLERWYDLIIANIEDLATIITLEQGKPLAEARTEIRYGASFVKWFAEEARRVYGETIPANESDRRIFVLKQAVGVCAAITPWNFPIAMITRKVGPALAAGCTIVVKPSELTPYSSLALAVLAQRAGIPDGVLNVVTGLPEGIGSELTSNPTIRKLSFTGSTNVGRILMRQCSETIKRVSFELGGNAPFLIFDDADVDLAVAGLMASKFRNAGQTCVCANRILVQDGIYPALAKKLIEAVAALKVGSGFDSDVAVGPLISRAAVEKVNRHVANAIEGGAKTLLGGASGRDDQFCAPTILGDATPDMLLAREETFGPVAPLFRFSDPKEAVRFANATPFGLASYVYTSSLNQAFAVGEKLEFGMVGLNTGSVSTEVAPFGGMKESGIGREGSRHGIDEYLEMKALHLGGVPSL
ncbi:NAD-dependent succinate-semialdehyde dehydrogenase [Bradyrhizobium sp.]|uniref:NAD-dependent succinate-semialdehyde dehydrogenase n=1 Tax=Bradyrhizobium sp. TaxID=376 RepID=UPI0039E590D0